MSYDDAEVNELRRRLWNEAYGFARELRHRGRSLSGLELLMVLHQMIEETHHHWVEDRKSWDDILAEGRR
jgi:hypothetical protein